MSKIDGRLSSIKHMQIAMGNQCNQKCVFCYQEHLSARDNVTEALWKGKLRPVYDYLDDIVIIGGEPTIMQNVKDMVEFLRPFDIKISFITNGKKFDGYWQDVFVERGRKVTFSANAATEETHRVVCKGGDFEALVDSTKALLAKRTPGTLEVVLSYVITKENYSEIVQMVELSADLGVDRAVFVRDFSRGLTGLEREIIPLLEKALQLADDRSFPCVGLVEMLFDLTGRPELVEQLRTTADRNLTYYSKRCMAPWNSLYVEKDGWVSFCCAAWLPMGHLDRDSLEEILNSRVARQMRKRISRDDYSMCKRDCTVHVGPKLSKPRPLAAKCYFLARHLRKLKHDPVKYWGVVKGKLKNGSSLITRIRG